MLRVSELRTDEFAVFIAVDSLADRITDGGYHLDHLNTFAVTNDKSGEPGEDARTYLVQRYEFALQGDNDTVVHTCNCKGFKYHRTPPLGTFDSTKGENPDDPSTPPIEDAIAEVGECKHIEKARKVHRADPASDAAQAELVELRGGQ